MKKKTIIISVILLIVVAALSTVLLLRHEKQPALTTQDFGSLSETAEHLLRGVTPDGTLFAYEGSSHDVTVTAAAGASVSVLVGAERYEAVPGEPGADGFCAYSVRVTMPLDRTGIEAIGQLKIEIQKDGQSLSAAGPQVVYQTQDTSDTSSPVANHVETSPSETSTLPPTTQPLPVGRTFCMVTVPFADTWSGYADDDNFAPTYTPLMQGTIDYITGQSRVFDEEEDEWRDFFLLSSGRKVKTDAVQLLPGANYGDNAITLVSSSTSNGALELRLRMAWNVPYSFEYAPQNYFSKSGKQYHVDAFRITTIQFTFYNTTSAEGAVQLSGSEVITAAQWTVDRDHKTASLTMPLRTAGKYYGYRMRRDPDGTLVLTLNAKPNGIAGARVMLDPGHGGKDSGALGFSGAVWESNVNFALAVATKNALERRGATVLFTRTNDTYLSLEDRKNIARQMQCDVYISIHCNAAENKTRFGTSTYYFRPMSQPLAQSVYQQILAVYQNGFYASDPARRSIVGEGANFHPFSVTRLEECPSILIETGYVTNDRECELLLNAANRDRLGEAIAAGVEDYLRP